MLYESVLNTVKATDIVLVLACDKSIPRERVLGTECRCAERHLGKQKGPDHPVCIAAAKHSFEVGEKHANLVTRSAVL